MEHRYHKNLHLFSVLNAIAVLVLILAGATVTSTGSGDAVPDWPLSYGSLNPPMKGGILFEHSHRLIAGFTGFLIAILAFWLWRRESRSLVRRLGLAALIAVIFQAVLGGLRVLVVSTEAVQDAATQITGTAVEPTRIAIAVVHASLAQTILCLIFTIVVLTSKSWLSGKTPSPVGRKAAGLKWFVLCLGCIVFFQLVIGAVVRHTNAGLSIPDFPLAFGRLIPPFGSLPNNPNSPFPVTDAELTFKVAIQFLHRLVALLILGMVIYLATTAKRAASVKPLILILFSLTITQVVLGALNIWTRKSPLSTIPHVAVGASILATVVILGLWIWREKIVCLPSYEPAGIKYNALNSEPART